MVRQTLRAGLDKESSVRFSAFFDELESIAEGGFLPKFAFAVPNPLKALKVGPFSTNVLNRSSLRMSMPSLQMKPPAVGKVRGLAQPLQAPKIQQINPQRQGLSSQSQLAPPASPMHVAPQTTPQAAATRQGGAQTVSTATPQQSPSSTSRPR